MTFCSLEEKEGERWMRSKNEGEDRWMERKRERRNNYKK